jgi:predicted transcriptional regulator
MMLFNGSKNGNKNRNKLDIIRDVLSIASVKVKKTRIMYQANLSYTQLEKYLAALLSGGLVHCDGDCVYLITQRGKEFLKAYECHLMRCSQTEKDLERNSKERKMIESLFLNGEGNGQI